jgi:signal peptidase I
MKKFFWAFFEVVETIVIAVVAVVLVRMFVVQPFVVSGASMEPSFYNGNYLLVDELTYRFREPQRGEVIVFRYPGDNKSFYIKRIIAFPGEHVKVQDGKVTVTQKNGEEVVLEEPYLGDRITNGSFDRVLLDGEYFVMGDNRNFSFDSRSWEHQLTRGNIVGLVKLKLWPTVEVLSVPRYTPAQ